MFMSLIAGLIFGVGSGYLEKIIAGPVREKLTMSDGELGILSFAGLMLVASIVVAALGVNSSAFWMVLGGVIGAFGIRAYLFGKDEMEKRKAAASETAEDLADEAVDTAEEAADAARSTAEKVAENA